MLQKIRDELKKWNSFKQKLKAKNWFVYFFVDTVEAVVTALVVALFIRAYVLQTSLVFSGSMEPTMMVKDRLFVNKLTYKFRSPQRGEIILFESPYKDDKEFVKRLIGLPGETVEVKKGVVYVDGKQLILPGINVQRDYDYFGPETIPSGNYFVLGDNRGNSADSRVWKWVPEKDLIGKALFVFWPLNRMQVLR